MIFASDNWAGAHPKIAESLVQHAGEFSSSYGTSDLDKKVGKRFSEIFEKEVEVFFVGTGTAANSIALTAANRPGGIAFCHSEAHVIADECGAPEYFMGGSRLYPVEGNLGRIEPQNLEQAIARFPSDFIHGGRPSAVTITQLTEIGTLYQLDQIDEIAAICRRHKIPLHMDGARFANALVALDTTPAEMTWKRGVDMLSFGGTKNGCWCAEAVILFNKDESGDLPFIRKRAAQLFSKSRFIAAQFDAYLENDLWLDTARHANQMAADLAQVLGASGKARLAWAGQGNEVFVIMNTALANKAMEAGAVFYDWALPRSCDVAISPDEALYRFVTSYAITPKDIADFAALLGTL